MKAQHSVEVSDSGSTPGGAGGGRVTRNPISSHPASIELAKSLNPETSSAQQRELRRLESENHLLREALRDAAYAAVMMIPITSGINREFARTVYGMCMDGLRMGRSDSASEKP